MKTIKLLSIVFCITFLFSCSKDEEIDTVWECHCVETSVHTFRTVGDVSQGEGFRTFTKKKVVKDYYYRTNRDETNVYSDDHKIITTDCIQVSE